MDRKDRHATFTAMELACIAAMFMAQRTYDQTMAETVSYDDAVRGTSPSLYHAASRTKMSRRFRVYNP